MGRKMGNHHNNEEKLNNQLACLETESEKRKRKGKNKTEKKKKGVSV